MQIEAPQPASQIARVDAIVHSIAVQVDGGKAASEGGAHLRELLHGRCNIGCSPQYATAVALHYVDSRQHSTAQQCGDRWRVCADAHGDWYRLLWHAGLPC